MGIYRNVVSLIYYFFFGKEPTKKIERILEPDEMATTLTVVAIHGYTVKVKCKQMKYLVKYESVLIPNETSRVYQLTSTCTSDAPEKLKLIVNSGETIYPCVGFFYTSEINRRKKLMEVYIEDLIKKA